MPMSLEGKIQLFSKIFVKEFTREFVFLTDVAAGRATRRSDFTDKLISIISRFANGIANGVPMLGPLVEVLGDLGALGAEIAHELKTIDESNRLPKLSAGLAVTSLWSLWHERQKTSESEGLARQSDLLDVEALRVLLECSAREAAWRHEFFLHTHLADEEDAVIAFAKCGVTRALEYLARTGKEITQETILQGLIEGRSGKFIQGWKNTRLSSKIPSETTLTAEGVYGRSAFIDVDSRRTFVRNVAKHKEVSLRLLAAAGGGSVSSQLRLALSNYGYVKYKPKKTRDYPKYGYLHVPTALIQQYDFQPHATASEETRKEVESYVWQKRTITLTVLKAYLDYIKLLREAGSPIPSLLDYVAALPEYPGVKAIAFRGDVSAEDLQGGNYQDVDWTGVIFSGNLSGTIFTRALLIGAKFKNISSAVAADFSAAHCEYMEVEGEANFSGACFNQTYFQFASLAHADLSLCEMLGAQWYGADLSEVKGNSALLEEQQKQIALMQENVISLRQAFIDAQHAMADQWNVMNRRLDADETEARAALYAHEERLKILEKKVKSSKFHLVPTVDRLLEQLSVQPMPSDVKALKELFKALERITDINDYGAELIWNKIHAVGLSHILLPTEMPYTLLPTIRRFYQVWKSHAILSSDEVLFAKAYELYHVLVNVELERAKSYLGSSNDNDFKRSLMELYELGMIAWGEIDDPCFMILEPITKERLLHKREISTLFSRVLRLFIDLEVLRHFEREQTTKEGGIAVIRSVFSRSVHVVGEIIYRWTGRQYLLSLEGRAHVIKYDKEIILTLRGDMQSLCRRLANSRESKDRASYDIIQQELTQANEGLKCLPQTSLIKMPWSSLVPSFSSLESVLSFLGGQSAMLPGLLMITWQLFKELFNKDYAYLLSWRSMIASTLCNAVTKQEVALAKECIISLQQALLTTVKERNRSLSYGLLDILGFIAAHAFSPELCCGAFLGFSEVEVPLMTVAEFIEAAWGNHSRLSALHHLAIDIFRTMILKMPESAFPLLLQRLSAAKEDDEREELSIQLLTLFHEWVTDADHASYASAAKDLLYNYLNRCMRRILAELNPALSPSTRHVSQWCKRALLVEEPMLWDRWVKENKIIKLSDEVDVTTLLALLSEFYERAAREEIHVKKKACYLVLTFLINISGKKETHALLKFIQLSEEQALVNILQGVLHALFKYRNVLSRKMHKQEKLDALLFPLIEVLLSAELRDEASGFLYHYLLNALFFTEKLRFHLASMIPTSVEKLPAWYIDWQQECQSLVCFSDTERLSSADLSVYLEYCVNGKFEVQGQLNPAVYALLDEQGYLQRRLSSSKSVVNWLDKPALHLKKYPDFPGNEIAARSLYGHLTGQWHRAKLVWFSIQQHGIRKERYPVLLTQTVPGHVLTPWTLQSNQKVIEQRLSIKEFHYMNDEIFKRNFQRSFSWQIIYALLARLGDAKANNYILSREGCLHPIDLEEFWRPAFMEAKEVEKWQEAQTQKCKISYPVGIKNILFLMPEMDNQVDSQVVDDFLQLSPESLLQAMLADSAMYNQDLQSAEIAALEADYERKADKKSKKQDDGTVSILKFSFKSDSVTQCYDDCVALQTYLSRMKREGSSVSHAHLLNEIEPALAALYQRVREEKTGTVNDKFTNLTDGLYNPVIVKSLPAVEGGAASAEVQSVESRLSLRTASLHLSLRKQHVFTEYFPYDPENMDGCQELEISVAAHTDIALITRALEKNNFVYLEAYFSDIETNLKKQRVLILMLRNMDFSSCPESESIFIKNFLKILGKKRFDTVRYLRITSARFLTDTHFSELIKHFPRLCYLELENCKNLGQNSFIGLADYCPEISVMKVKNLPSLKNISGWLFSLSYPGLSYLAVIYCGHLKGIYIDAPNLYKISINNNSVLKTVVTNSTILRSLDLAYSSNITTKLFSRIAAQWQSLKELDISSCVHIRLDQLIFWPIVRETLQALHFQNCFTEYGYYLDYPQTASLLSTIELEYYLYYFIKWKMLRLHHLSLPFDKTHWLVGLLSAENKLQADFVRYLLSLYIPDSTDQAIVYRWLSELITIGILTVLDFSCVSCDYLQSPIIQYKETRPMSGEMVVLPNGQIASPHPINCKDEIQFWDTKTRECTAILRSDCKDTVIRALIILPNNQQLVSGSFLDSGVIKIWDIQTGKCTDVLRGHTNGIWALAALPHDRLASGSEGCIKLWDLKTRQCTSTFSIPDNLAGQGQYVLSLLALPDGRLASGESCTIRLWDIHKGHYTVLFNSVSYAFSGPSSESIYALAVLPTGLLVSATYHTLRFWDVYTKQCLVKLSDTPSVLRPTLAMLPNGLLASGADGGLIKLWNTQSQACMAALRVDLTLHKTKLHQERGANIEALVVLPDGRMVSKTCDSVMYYWSFPRSVIAAYAKLIADALTCSSSVTTLIGIEFISDVYLRRLISLRVKRNILLQKLRIQEPNFSLAQAATLVGDREAAEILAKQPTAEVNAHSEVKRLPTSSAFYEVDMTHAPKLDTPEKLLASLTSMGKIIWQDTRDGGAEEHKAVEETLLLCKADNTKTHIKQVIEHFTAHPDATVDVAQWKKYLKHPVVTSSHTFFTSKSDATKTAKAESRLDEETRLVALQSQRIINKVVFSDAEEKPSMTIEITPDGDCGFTATQAAMKIFGHAALADATTRIGFIKTVEIVIQELKAITTPTPRSMRLTELMQAVFAQARIPFDLTDHEALIMQFKTHFNATGQWAHDVHFALMSYIYDVRFEIYVIDHEHNDRYVPRGGSLGDGSIIDEGCAEEPMLTVRLLNNTAAKVNLAAADPNNHFDLLYFDPDDVLKDRIRALGYSITQDSLVAPTAARGGLGK